LVVLTRQGIGANCLENCALQFATDKWFGQVDAAHFKSLRNILGICGSTQKYSGKGLVLQLGMLAQLKKEVESIGSREIHIENGNVGREVEPDRVHGKASAWGGLHNMAVRAETAGKKLRHIRVIFNY